MTRGECCSDGCCCLCTGDVGVVLVRVARAFGVRSCNRCGVPLVGMSPSALYCSVSCRELEYDERKNGREHARTFDLRGALQLGEHGRARRHVPSGQP